MNISFFRPNPYIVKLVDGQQAFDVKLETGKFHDPDKGREVASYHSVTVITEKGTVKKFQDYDPGNTTAPLWWGMEALTLLFSWNVPSDVPADNKGEWIPC